MSQESLQVVEQDAVTLYANHKVYAELGSSSLTQSPKMELTDFDKEVGLTESYDHSVDYKGFYDANIRVAAQFAADNAEQLHELAIDEDKNR